MFPNVRALNLNFNFIEKVGGWVKGLKRLRKASFVGNRIGKWKEVVEGLKGLDELERVDLRFEKPFSGVFCLISVCRSNPCTIGYYMALLDGDEGMDDKFRRGLPDDVYMRRLVYRGMMMNGHRRMEWLDGVRIRDGERKKAEELLAKVGLLELA